MNKINCFVPFSGAAQAEKTVKGLQETGIVNNIYLLALPDVTENLPGCSTLHMQSIQSSTAMRDIAGHSDAEYTLIYTKYTTLELGLFALERMIHIAEDSGAGMVYADRYQVKEGKQTNAPVIDYQFGSLRDDFDFGSVLLFRTDAFKEAAARMNEDEYKFAGLYDLRLKVSQKESLVHINEYLYSEIEDDTRKSGEKIFDYVDPRNRDRQIEMEQACTEHLKEIGGYLVHASKIRRAGVPIRTGYTIEKAYGTDALEGVVIVQVDSQFQPVPGTEETIPCDTLCLAVGLAPLTELCWQAGCDMAFIRELSGHIPLTDENLETSVPGVYAAGDVSGIEEASSAMVEGRLAGCAAAESLGYEPVRAAAEKEAARSELSELRSGPAGARILSGLEKARKLRLEHDICRKGGASVC